MATDQAPKIAIPVTVDTNELTLAEVDRAGKLVDNGEAPGRITALAYVWLKREHPGVRMADVANLRMRDVNVVDDDDESDTSSDPTPAR